MPYSRFAPPELLSAVSVVSDDEGRYPGALPDPVLAGGTHLRVYAGLGASFPLAPLAVFRVRSYETEGMDIAVKGGGRRLDPQRLELYGGEPAEVTLLLPERAGIRHVRMDLAVDGALSTVDLLDQRGRVVGSRDRPGWSFAAPVLHALRATGSAEVRLTPREVAIETVLRIDPAAAGHGLLGLPLSDRRRAATEYNWYVAVHSRDDGLGEVGSGAPLRLNPMDLPGIDPLPLVGSSSELARIDSMAGEQYLASIARMLSDHLPPWAMPPDVLGAASPPAGSIQRLHAPAHGMLQLVAADPGMARFLGMANSVRQFPDIAGDGHVSGWDTLAVVGLLAYSPSRFAHLRPALGPIPDDWMSERLIALIAAAMDDFCDGAHDAQTLLEQRIAFARGQGCAVAPFVALTSPLLPQLAPVLPEPQVVRRHWQVSDGLGPSSRYRADFAFPDPPPASMTALGRGHGDGYASRHEQLTDLPANPDRRSVPRLLGYESEPNARANQTDWTVKVQTRAGLITDHDIPAETDAVEYVAYASDAFGRFGDPTRFQLTAPPRPGPPKPVLRYQLDTSAVPPGQAPASPGTLTVTVIVPPPGPFTPEQYQSLGRTIVVPRLTDLAPGARPLTTLRLTFNGEDWSPALTTPGEQSHTFTLPELTPQGSGQPLLTGWYVDSADTASEQEHQKIPIQDRRPYTPLDTGIGLFWTSAPGPAPDVEIRLAWNGPANARHRVYLTDAEGLNPSLLTGEPRCVIAEKGCEQVIAGSAGDRRAVRLLTDPPLQSDAAGRVLFTARLPRSLATVQFLRMVPLGPGGSEPPFDTCNIVPVAVPDSRQPVPPQLDAQVDQHTGVASATVSTTGFDLVALAKEEPGLFTPGAPGAEAPRFRLRRAVGAVADPVYARVRHEGSLTYRAATGDRPASFTTTVDDVEDGPLEPFVRYVYWAEARLPDERRLKPGTVPLDAGVTAPHPAAGRAHPRPLSRPSAPRALMYVPEDLPEAPDGATATRAVEGTEIVVTVAIPAPPRAHVKAVERFRLAVWAQWDGGTIDALAVPGAPWPDVEGGTVRVPVVPPAGTDGMTAHLKVRIAFGDPLGRVGVTSTVPVP